MRIALNATVFKNPLSGVGKRVTALVRHASRLRPDLHWIFLAPHPVRRPDFPGASVEWHDHGRRPEFWWLRRTVPRLLKACKADVFEAPWGGGLPLAGEKPCPYLTTFHDTIPLDAGAWLGERLRYRRRARENLSRADGILAVSEFTRRRLVTHFKGIEGKITVLPNGVDGDMTPSAPADVEAFRAAQKDRRGLGPYVLYLGGFNRRKNVETLLRAFHRLPAAAFQLVLAGNPNPYFHKNLAPLIQRLKLKDRVVLPGYLPEAELPLWYSAAAVTVYPSLHEGFGMPVLEALACGAPVIAQQGSAVAEFAEGAALLVDAKDPVALASAMDEVTREKAPGPLYRAAGLEMAESYRWPNLARRYLAILEEAVRLWRTRNAGSGV